MKDMTKCLLLLLFSSPYPPLTSVSFSFWSAWAHLSFSFAFPYSVYIAQGSSLSVSGCSTPMHMGTIRKMEYKQKQEASQNGMSRGFSLYCSWGPDFPERLSQGEGSAILSFYKTPNRGLYTSFMYSIQEATLLVKCQGNYRVCDSP